ncbi:ATP-binding protein [Streptomyces sp. NPDC089919]|uniref:sensor histidine kinase n=1 Tax=Streptomyces sp. NPDC089919 TaxID=3155188 RepID=UPI00343FA246
MAEPYPAGPAPEVPARGTGAGPRVRRPRAAALFRRLAPHSVRARTTLAACASVAVVMVAASAVVLMLLRTNLERTVEPGVRQQARALSRLAADGRLAARLPLGPGTDFIQVVDGRGRVLARSENLAGRPALAPSGPRRGHRTYNLDALGEQHHQRVTAVTADTPDGPVTVLVGASLRTADAAEDLTGVALAVVSALLVCTVGFLTWRTTGRALRPVEAIRAEVAAIGDRELDRRVPAPRGGDEIARLADTMNAMLERLEEAGARQRRFIADASHELRSPLAVLRTQLEVARTHPDPEVREDLVAGALEDTERLQALSADLLLLARLDVSGQRRAEDPVDLTALVRATVAGRPADARTVTLHAPGHVTLHGNALWLGRLLTNLLDNAQRHARGSVTVRLAEDPVTGDAVLDVANDGPPVAAADRERIFERFTRLDDARSRDEGGTGLGLSIARDIAALHGGTITVLDTPDGTVFRTRLTRGAPA